MMADPVSEADVQAMFDALRSVMVHLPDYEDDDGQIEWSIIRLARDTAASGVLGGYIKEPPPT